ncbi:SDR family NAD(P)-dependent oxidoreductase [Actinomadura barringtoniae]|uniref:SDR family NAD(P)-dependent oxidoreductase n=1 Tax=Actinomadura barringtoniae TaxID=1427535 RepID=A0A939PVV2_9ACTN|nr:type I polyketide synthase [Actinomadura barringtoniae]MBO2455776.1 SDR family NAD(P)-dependent oxidoreductase [Actinomadura barringtoniae]
MTEAAMTGAIAIVGMGCRYPDADGPDRLWETVLAGRRAFRGIPRTRLNPDDYVGEAGDPDRTYARTAAVLEGWEFDRARFRVPGPAHRVTDPAHWLALEVASEALADAGFPGGEGLDRDRVSVVLGNTMAGEVSRAAQLRLRWPYVRRTVAAALAGEGLDDPTQARLLARLEQTYKAPFPEPNDESLAGGLANTIAGRICNHFDLRGGGHTVDGACASSLLSVIAGCSALLSGDADLVLAGGVDLSLDPFELVGFARTGALATDAMRVYDAAPTGFWPGEGCGMVALMRSEDAIAAGRTPLATVQGWGTSSDGQGGITRPEAGGQLLALRRAYRRAGFGPQTVGLFEGHGTGTAVGDRAELEALIAAHEGSRRNGPPAALGTVKANIGHTKAAAGVAGLIKAVQALRHRVLPPTTGCETPHPLLEDAPLRVVGEAEAWPDGPIPARAAVSAMGFGGINTHVVLEAAQHVPGQVTLRGPLGEQVFVMAAWSREELHVLLDRIAVRAETMSHAELLDLAATLPTEGEFRVGIVASDPGRLARRARLAARLETGGGLAAGPGIYAGSGARMPIGLLFTGQGSAVKGTAVDGGTDTAVAQPAIIGAALAALRRLERLGVRAAGAVGHSLGEIAALHWAGALTENDAMTLAERRGRIMAAQGRSGTGMASVAAEPDAVAELLRGTRLVVAADNGVAQVIAGDLGELDAVVAKARDQGLTVRRLEVGHAYHSPAMAAVAEPLAAFLAGMLISVPGRPVHSTITGVRLSADEDLRGLLVRQVTAPVRFREAVSGLARECGLLVEVGPAGGLAGLAEAVTGVPAVTLNAGGVAALFAAGAIRDAAPLFAGRFRRPFDLWRDPVFLESPCERAPEVRIPQQRTVQAPVPRHTRPGHGSVAETVRRLVAEALELPLDAIGDGDRLLADLHLNSLRVAQLAGRAATDCGRAAPTAPPALADATVGAVIEMIEALPRAGSADPAAPVAGVGEWHRILVPEPVAPEPAPVVGDDAVRVVLPEAPGDDDMERLVAAARDSLAYAVPLEVVDPGNVASGFVGTLRAEHPELTVHHVPGNAVRHRPLIFSGEASGEPEFPFGPQDVALITGGAKGIGLESARALARHGVRLVLMGRSADLDPAAVHGLGDDVRYVNADVTDADAVAKALAAIGPVSVLIHAAGVNRPARFADLDAADFADHAAPKVRGLANVLDALDALDPSDNSVLRAVVTYGSVIGRFGLAGEAHYALANGRMRELVRRTAARLPGCWVCNVEWTVWSGAGMGDRLDVLDGLGRAGVVPLPAERGGELLLRLLAARPAVPSVLVTGRLPALEAEAEAGVAGPHRVHTPGVELVTERELTASAPLLADHRVSGVTVVPAVVMLEAMASAARELTGRAPSGFADLRWHRPVTVPDEGARTLRICALRREDGTVDLAVRTDETGFEVDHAAGRTAGGPLTPPGVAAPETAPPAHEGAELYGSLFFHGPAYQRLIRYERLESKGCAAILRGGDGLAIDDASIHVLQGCVPHRRLLPVGCEAFARHPYENPGGELRVTAVERDHQGADYTYDVVVTATSDGRPVLSWRGLRLRDAGPLEHPGGLPAVLAGPYLERNAGALLGKGRRVRVESELCLPEEPSPWPGVAGEIVRLTGEPEEHAFTRVRTVEECLSQQGRDAASVPLTVEGVYEDGWVLMRVGNATAASCVLRLAGRTDPVAVAVLAEGEEVEGR